VFCLLCAFSVEDLLHAGLHCVKVINLVVLVTPVAIELLLDFIEQAPDLFPLILGRQVICDIIGLGVLVLESPLKLGLLVGTGTLVDFVLVKDLPEQKTKNTLVLTSKYPK
jgi:hypothetical protein